MQSLFLFAYNKAGALEKGFNSIIEMTGVTASESCEEGDDDDVRAAAVPSLVLHYEWLLSDL